MAAAPMINSAIAIATILELNAALAVAAMVTYAVVPYPATLSVWLIGFDLGVSIWECSSDCSPRSSQRQLYPAAGFSAGNANPNVQSTDWAWYL